MTDETPLSKVIGRLKHLRDQDRRNTAEAYAAAAQLVQIADHSLETSSQLIEEFTPDEPPELAVESLRELEQLQKSQRALQQFNDSYRVQRELTLQLLKERQVDPAIIAEVEALNDRKSRSIRKRIDLFAQQTDWQRSKIIQLIKGYVQYSTIDD